MMEVINDDLKVSSEWIKEVGYEMLDPDGFWMKGNVEMVCSLYDIPLFNTLDEFKIHLTK
jgi:hypothetical protein